MTSQMSESLWERRILVALVSLIRDKQRDPAEWTTTDIRLARLYERLYVLAPEGSYELQRRNQRQAARRALGRLHKQGLVGAIALGWMNVEDGELLRWQGGGSHRSYKDGYRAETPRWRMVFLTSKGVERAVELEVST